MKCISTLWRDDSMVQIRQLDTLGEALGAFDSKGKLILVIERSCLAPECEVRKFERHHPKGRGRLVVTFVGVNSLGEACHWATRYLSRREGRPAYPPLDPRIF